MSTDAQALLQHIKKNTYTQDDMYRRLGVFRECIEYAVYTNTGLSQEEECENFLSKLEDQADANAIRSWGAAVFTAFNQHNTSDLLKDLQEKVYAMPLLVTYIPVEFPQEEIAKLGDWVREHIHEDIVLEIHVEPTVVGGVAFVWNDTYHDFSFHGRRDEVLSAIAQEMAKYGNE